MSTERPAPQLPPGSGDGDLGGGELHGELTRDWHRALDRGPRLTARQRQVVDGLAAGASEKELAFQLGVSTHTLHDDVKAIHRAYGVRSRGELLARWGADMRRPRVRLVVEGPG